MGKEKKRKKDKKNKKGKSKKDKKNKRLTVAEQRDNETKIRNMIGKNKTPTEMMKRLDMQPHVLQQYITRIYDIDRENFGKMDDVTVYSNYLARSDEMIKELDELRIKFKNRGQWTALVAAVKEKRSIYNDVLKLGQNFGFISTKKNEIHIENEFSYATMTIEEVEKELEREILEMNQMVGSNIIEMRPEIIQALDEDTEKIKRFLPDNVTRKVSVDDEPVKRIKIKKKKIKRKTKLIIRR